MGKKRNGSQYPGYSGGNPYGSAGYGSDSYAEDPFQNDGSYPSGGLNNNSVDKKGEYDLASLLISVVAGVLCFFVGNSVYVRLMFGNMWRPLVIGLFFLIVTVFLLVAARLCAAVGGYSRASMKDNLKALAIVVVIFLSVILFEFVYERDLTIFKREENAPAAEVSSYVFLIDTTVSMQSNDPYHESEAAISEVMSNERNMDYCVYTFSDDAELYHGMKAASRVKRQSYSFEYDGLCTDILQSLDTVLDDIAVGKIAAGNRPLILIVTDGESNGNEMDLLLDKADRVNAILCAIGFGGAEETFVESLTARSSGVFRMIDNASNITSSFRDVVSDVKRQEILATTAGYQRDMLSTRERAGLDWVLAAERILFLAALGFMYLLLKSFQIRSGGSSLNTLVPNIVVIAIGAMSIEIGMNLLHFPAWLMRMIMCICFTLIIVCRGEKASVAPPNHSDSSVDIYGIGIS